MTGLKLGIRHHWCLLKTLSEKLDRVFYFRKPSFSEKSNDNKQLIN